MKILTITPNTPGLAVWPLLKWLESQSPHEVTSIMHPVAPVPGKRYSLLGSRQFPREPKHLSLFSYLGDLALTLASQLPHTYDYAICITPHLAYSGLLLRHLGRVKRVVYYALDYYPKRYGPRSTLGGGILGGLLEKGYRGLEKKIVKKSDVLWTITRNMLEGWKEGGYTWNSPLRYVPHTIPSRASPLRYENKTRDIIWSGTSREGSGLEILASCWPSIFQKTGLGLTLTCRTRFPAGYDWLLNRPEVCYLGFIPEEFELRRIVSQHKVGLATYQADSFKRYSDAARLKMYLSLGVPAIVSGVPDLRKEFVESGAGIYLEGLDEGNLVEAIDRLRREEENTKASIAAYDLARTYLIEEIFPREAKFLEEIL